MDYKLSLIKYLNFHVYTKNFWKCFLDFQLTDDGGEAGDGMVGNHLYWVEAGGARYSGRVELDREPFLYIFK